MSKIQAPAWLGLFCFGKSWDELNLWLDAATEYGFREIQAGFGWEGYTPADLERLGTWLTRHEIRCRTFGVYNDMLRWDQPIQLPTTGATLEMVAANAATCGIQYLVTWSGSYGGFLAEEPRNHTPEAFESLKANVTRILPALRQANVTLALEPWRAHVLRDEHVAAELCSIAPDALSVVLDPPNYIAPSQWAERGQRLQSILDASRPCMGVLHLKDMAVQADGKWSLPMFGRGGMDHKAVLDGMRPYFHTHPVVAEHIAAPADLPELLETIERFS